MTKKQYNSPEILVASIETMSFLCVSEEEESNLVTYIGTQTDDQW